ncbi:acyl-CoA dehydrogenase family protein [Microbacterium sp. No. 7]|uniref:acyl-CoA dehydrogenase family protein n=1 Tax=Microbacterium sp. No. 7 TaxID=1714373 RepID=UPI0006CFB80D|nr:acyl-CoA dehydrogenase family protein [Microbacterium sp. No. 7]ALJ21885.1 acyl-CoA dehydrogenase [Microbacterium sp. No. 7]
MYALSDDQTALIDAVRGFADAAIAPFANEWDRTRHFPVDVLAQAGELGLGGIYTREQWGGAGLSRTDTALVFETLARADTALAAYISIHNMVTWMIDAFGDDAQRERWLPGLTSMTRLGSYCLTEPGAGSDAAALTTRAARDGDEYVIDGVKQFISGAGTSSVYIVMARTGEPGPRGVSAIVVPDGTPGLSFGPLEHKMGWSLQPTRQVILDGVRVPVTHRLGEEGAGFGIAMKGLNGGRLNVAACSLGGAQWALDRTIAYMGERTTFGKRLSEHEALLFRLSDMATQLRAARGLLREAAEALDSDDPGVVPLCAMAKQFVTDVAFTVANDALQLHGGYGYLSEYGIERVVRDLRAHQILEGTNEIMRLIVGRSLVAA